MGLFGFLVGTSIMGGRAVAKSTSEAFYNALQDSRAKKDIKSLCHKAADQNFANRMVYFLPGSYTKQEFRLISGKEENDVYDYQVKDSQLAGLDFVYGESDEPEGLIVSGGSEKNRVVSLIPFVIKAREKGIPLIAIHFGNREMEKMLSEWSNIYERISRKACFYDVFRGMTSEDIANILYQSMPATLAKPAAFTLLKAIVETMDFTEDDITMDSLAHFSIGDVGNKMNTLLVNKSIEQVDHARIMQNYQAGSSEMNTVSFFLSELNREAVSVYGRENNKRSNVRRIINQHGTLSIDLGNVQNTALTDLVISHLLFLQSQGREFVLLLDGFPIANCNRIGNLLLSCTYAVSSQDFIASLSGGQTPQEELFAAISGSVTRTVLLKHTAGNSARKWSEYMGTYTKIRIRRNLSHNTSYDHSNYSEGVTVDEKEEPRVSVGTLTMLPDKWACIYSSDGILFAEINEPQ